jgi:hypothetical protein
LASSDSGLAALMVAAQFVEGRLDTVGVFNAKLAGDKKKSSEQATLKA